MRVFGLLISVLLLTSCEKLPESYDTLSGLPPMVIGHGGSGESNFQNTHPWNSEQSIMEALAKGADGVELDIQMSADGVLMLFHDETLLPATQCAGCISTHQADFLTDCAQSAGIFQSEEDYPLLRLDEVLDRLSSLDAHPIVCLDIRLGETCPSAADPSYRRDQLVTALMEASASYPALVITSFDRDLLSTLASLGIEASMQLAGDYSSDWASIFLTIADGSGIDGVITYFEEITAAQIDDLHAAGYTVTLFGPFSASSHRSALAKGPDAIITDNITLLQSLLE